MLLTLGSVGRGEDREVIRLANRPALSPDGRTLAFSWGGDLWSVSSSGGQARPLTRHQGMDRDPAFSPDGLQIAFVSNREGHFHVYVMPAEGGVPRQVAFHSSGYTLQGWAPDGHSLLVSGARDHFWKEADRFFLIKTDERTAEVPLFDAAGRSGALSPDGKRLLFTREGPPWWRKGYRGSQASQVWMYDLEAKSFTKLLDPPGGALWPLWRADGRGFYYVGVHKGALNLRERDLANGGGDRPLTEFDDDSVVFPCISRDGSTIVFRHLFDFYRLRTASDEPLKRLEIWYEGDLAREPVERRTLTRASQAAFSRDGLEVAFISGGDLWVMDTELREPRQVTATPEEERDPVFSPGGDSILFVSETGGQPDLWRAERSDPARDWWQNTSFKLDRLTQDAEDESEPRFSPDGSAVAFLKGRGDLWVMAPNGKDLRRVVASWNRPRYDWSPDGRWFVYSRSDEDFNDDIWIAPLDGSRPPFNLSRHPDNESDPVWSPDGRLIAFTGRRVDTEVDIYFVWLRADDDEKTSRERTIEKALEKIKQARKKGGRPGRSGDPAAKGKSDDAPAAPEEPKATVTNVVIDFDRIHERIRRVSIPDSTERSLFWSPDSKKLGFTGMVDGKTGVYTIEFPDDRKPKPLTSTLGRDPRWLEAGNQIVWLANGVPASLTPSGKETSYGFRVPQQVDRAATYRAAFDLCWRTMRDHFYDERLGNRNWDAVRRKYADAAAHSPDNETFGTVVSLMLGELNGSHLGFTPSAGGAAGPRPRGFGGGGAEGPVETTAHLGLRFDPGHRGPGLKVRDVIPDGPADHKTTRVAPGELVLAIDGTTVDPALDLTRVLNGPLDRDVRLLVRGNDDKEREVIIRPISYESAQARLYEKWVKDNRKRVEEGSKGTLGYLHIRGMNFASFYRFEEELYSAAAGKDGLIIDVRENGGGSTTDHLLTALTQPSHAITVPRGGGPGYPQDRRVYATWQKPIVVLCNQNSFSNAEIFSHAIKTLKRGKLVGTPTAGGVISTGGRDIMNLGTLRLPGRGWFLIDTGEDMELNGAVPDHVVWPDPSDFARGVDAQLDKAVEVLAADVKDAAQRPRPRLRKASEREDNRAAVP
jgi:tricorn protease